MKIDYIRAMPFTGPRNMHLNVCVKCLINRS